jgi:hypothetical protein
LTEKKSAGALAVIDAEHVGIDLSLRTTPADQFDDRTPLMTSLEAELHTALAGQERDYFVKLLDKLGPGRQQISLLGELHCRLPELAFQQSPVAVV